LVSIEEECQGTDGSTNIGNKLPCPKAGIITIPQNSSEGTALGGVRGQHCCHLDYLEKYTRAIALVEICGLTRFLLGVLVILAIAIRSPHERNVSKGDSLCSRSLDGVVLLHG